MQCRKIRFEFDIFSSRRICKIFSARLEIRSGASEAIYWSSVDDDGMQVSWWTYQLIRECKGYIEVAELIQNWEHISSIGSIFFIQLNCGLIHDHSKPWISYLSAIIPSASDSFISSILLFKNILCSFKYLHLCKRFPSYRVAKVFSFSMVLLHDIISKPK